MNIVLRTALADDHAVLHALNEQALPHVNRIDLTEMTAIVAQSCCCELVSVDGEIAGFILALREGNAYQSPNYRWFAARYPVFVYVDRIVVAGKFSRLGLGAKLYGRLDKQCRGEAVPLLACEVNLQPPNPASIAFHRSIGFAEVGRQATENGEKLVSLMVKKLS